MPDATFEILNLQDYNATVERLRNLGARNRDITAIFRNGSQPLVREMKSRAGRSRYGILSSRYQSRLHPPGSLRRSVKFKTSKKYQRVFYILPTSKKPAPDIFYKLYYIGGTSGSKLEKAAMMGERWVKGDIRGQSAHPFVEAAFNATQSTVFNKIVDGIYNLEKQLWR